MKIILVLIFFAFCSFAEVIHVSAGSGSPINKAMLQARSGDTIILAAGKYYEDVSVKAGVMLYSPDKFAAQIIGDGRESVVKLGSGSRLQGLSISGGRNGVLTLNSGAAIEDCYIHSNKGSGVLAVNRLPKITNSIISNNLNSGIMGNSIGSTEGELSHLTIAKNRKNGIEIEGDQNIYLQDCLFYRNGNRAIIIGDKNLLGMKNLLIYPEQREFASKEDLTDRPFFADKFYLLKDDSAGKNRASDGKDIGFVR